jgi:hypothetical protein
VEPKKFLRIATSSTQEIRTSDGKSYATETLATSTESSANILSPCQPAMLDWSVSNSTNTYTPNSLPA